MVNFNASGLKLRFERNITIELSGFWGARFTPDFKLTVSLLFLIRLDIICHINHHENGTSAFLVS